MNSVITMLAIVAFTAPAEDLMWQTQDPAVQARIAEFSDGQGQPDADQWVDVAELAVANGDGGLCLSALEQARVQGASGFWTQYLTGYCAEEAFQVQRAKNAYLEALRLEPENTSAWLRLAAIQHRTGDQGGMRESLDQVPPDRQDDPVWLALKGHQALNQEDWDGAVQMFASAIQADPTADGLFVPLATALRRRGDLDTAAKALASRGTGQPRPRDAYIQRVMMRSTSPGRLADTGVLVLKSGDLDAARNLFQRAVDQGGQEYAQAHYGLGYVSEEQGHLEEAQAHYRRAIATELHSNAALRLAGLLAADGHIDQAAALYERLLAQDPASFAARANYANTLLRDGQCDRALEHYLWLTGHHRGDLRGWQGAAICLDSAAQRERQFDLLEQARQALPHDPIIMEYWVRVASLLPDRVEPSKVTALARNLAQSSNRATAWEALALILARRGDLRQALATLDSLDEQLKASGASLDAWNAQLRSQLESGSVPEDTGISNRQLD